MAKFIDKEFVVIRHYFSNVRSLLLFFFFFYPLTFNDTLLVPQLSDISSKGRNSVALTALHKSRRVFSDEILSQCYHSPSDDSLSFAVFIDN